MSRKLSFLTSALVTLLATGSASAGVYSDDLGKCLVRSTSTEDQVVFIKWMFGALSTHPALQSMSAISDEERAAFSSAAGHLSQRLITVDCRNETIAALKYEGTSSLESAFSVLGGVATRAIMSDPKVSAQLGGLVSYEDQSKIQELLKEAGIPVKQQPEETTKP